MERRPLGSTGLMVSDVSFGAWQLGNREESDKALQALRLARRLRQAWERPVVALFWNHADAHDIAEVHHTWLVNENLDLQRIGLAQALLGEPDLLILDLMLPEVDGFQICEQIRLTNMDVPIIFLTAKDTPQDRITGLKKGVELAASIGTKNVITFTGMRYEGTMRQAVRKWDVFEDVKLYAILKSEYA